jgi:hypothetical protein
MLCLIVGSLYPFFERTLPCLPRQLAQLQPLLLSLDFVPFRLIFDQLIMQGLEFLRHVKLERIRLKLSSSYQSLQLSQWAWLGGDG